MTDLEACDICYDDCRNVITLDCCNKSKKVCTNCLGCLQSLTCPYCRNPLPDNVTCNMNVSRSQPNTENNNFYSFVQDEMLIDPFAPEYRDSRILRRQVRRMRRRFLSEHTRNRPSARERRTQRRRERHALRESLSEIVNLYNNDMEIFDIEL